MTKISIFIYQAIFSYAVQVIPNMEGRISPSQGWEKAKESSNQRSNKQ